MTLPDPSQLPKMSISLQDEICAKTSHNTSCVVAISWPTECFIGKCEDYASLVEEIETSSFIHLDESCRDEYRSDGPFGSGVAQYMAPTSRVSTVLTLARNPKNVAQGETQSR